MTARGYVMSENDRLQNHEEKKRLEERASAAAARKMDDKIIGEFLTKFEKDYRANINERKKGSK
jgi:hypothetical protein